MYVKVKKGGITLEINEARVGWYLVEGYERVEDPAPAVEPVTIITDELPVSGVVPVEQLVHDYHDPLTDEQQQAEIASLQPETPAVAESSLEPDVPAEKNQPAINKPKEKKK